MKFLKIFIFF